MNIVDIGNMIKNNEKTIFSPKGYKKILDMSNNLKEFDLLNKIIILIQNKSAFEVRSEEDWKLDNREVFNKNNPIYIVIPNTTYKYIDKETNKEIKQNELSQNEIVRALNYGIIYKDETIYNMYIHKMFDIRHTKQIDKSVKYIVNKPILDIKSLIQLLQKIMEVDIEISEETFYSKSENKVYMATKSYKQTVYDIIDILVDFYMCNIDSRYNIKNDKYTLKIIKNSLKYSISTLFYAQNDTYFDNIIDLSITDKLDILLIVDSIAYEIASLLQYKRNNLDVISKISLNRKAEAILNLMEAVSINNKMKGYIG